MQPHNMQLPQTVYLDTVVSMFIAFAVACASTSIQGLISHAFRQTIGDIVVSDNNLGDVDHIIPTFKKPTTEPMQTPARLSERRSWTTLQNNPIFSTINNAFEEPRHTNSKQNRYTGIDSCNEDDSFKRLDARGFFASP
jgi:hypothetical protein